MAPISTATVIAAAAMVAPGIATDGHECKKFSEIYANGKELCENMWSDSFVYEEDESKAYTMWFWEKENPNDKISQALGLLEDDHEVCHLNYYHKDTPGPEPDGFGECHPWKHNACCAHETVMSATTLNEAYGKNYHWDRCGPMSPQCERFMVQEACFYECDPNAGLFRKWNATHYDAKCDSSAEEYDEAYATAKDCDHNTWQMHKMPIKASYCDAWLTACANDKFCSADDGDFFTCAKHYEVIDLAAQLQEKKAEINDLKAKNDELKAENEKNQLSEVSLNSEGRSKISLGLLISIVALLSVFSQYLEGLY